MSEYVAWDAERVRGQTLLIVEGNHEKEKLFSGILKSFPEVEIETENILVFKTNIYILLNKIIQEYGDDWYLQDIDLPHIVSKDDESLPKKEKRNFKNIFLIFDYERHDPNFSEEKILKLQEYFSDSTDVGKLYINYPMVESYMDIQQLPLDSNFFDKKVTSNIQNGDIYKNSIKKNILYKIFDFPKKIYEILVERFDVNQVAAKSIVDNILAMNDIVKINDFLNNSLKGLTSEENINTFIYQLNDIISTLTYLSLGYSYYDYIRFVYKRITVHNIVKAIKIQFDIIIDESNLPSEFLKIDLKIILEKQNAISNKDGLAKIWVLNTCILLLADYNVTMILN